MEIQVNDFQLMDEHFENYADGPVKEVIRKHTHMLGRVPDVLHINGNVYVHKKHKKLIPHIVANLDPTTLKMPTDHWFGSSWGKKIGDRIKKIGDKVGDALKAAAFSPLLPFKNLMKKSIAKKGLKPAGKFGDLALQFFNEVVKKHGHYEQDNLLPLAIIPPIIAFIKDALSKKKAGAQLTPEEKLIADGSAPILAKVEADAKKVGVNLQDQTSIETAVTKGTIKDDSNKPSDGITVGGLSLSTPMLLGIGGAVALLIIVLAMRK